MRCGGVLPRHNSNNRDDKDKDRLVVVGWMICYSRNLMYCIPTTTTEQSNSGNSEILFLSLVTLTFSFH